MPGSGSWQRSIARDVSSCLVLAGASVVASNPCPSQLSREYPGSQTALSDDELIDLHEAATPIEGKVSGLLGAQHAARPGTTDLPECSLQQPRPMPQPGAVRVHAERAEVRGFAREPAFDAAHGRVFMPRETAPNSRRRNERDGVGAAGEYRERSHMYVLGGAPVNRADIGLVKMPTAGLGVPQHPGKNARHGAGAASWVRLGPADERVFVKRFGKQLVSFHARNVRLGICRCAPTVCRCAPRFPQHNSRIR